MALKEIGLSTNAIAAIDTAAGVSGQGMWHQSLQVLIASESLNPANTVYRWTLDGVQASSPFSGPANFDVESYTRDEAGALYCLCSDTGSAKWALTIVDPLSGSATQVEALGPAYGGSKQGRVIAYFSGSKKLVWVPTGDPYGLGNSGKNICIVDTSTAGWPLFGGTDNALVPGGLASNQICGSYKDLNSFFIYDVGGSTQLWEMSVASLLVTNTANLPRNNALTVFNPVAGNHITVIHDSDGGDAAKVATISELDDITSMDVVFIPPRFEGGTFISVIPRNSQGIAQANRTVSASLEIASGNAAVMGSLESTVETTNTNGVAVFRYISSATQTEPVAEDDIEFTVET